MSQETTRREAETVVTRTRPHKQIVLEGGKVTDVFSGTPLITTVAVGVMGVMGYGLYRTASGGSAMVSNQMMRLRVLGQAAVVAMVVAVPIYGYFKSNQPSSTPSHLRDRF
eukprot:TRINITY_DN6584_c0_g1_i4.p1 TRINITY_DN6584_c0_g1~~TRINITY_DN6584_c0_g1_i4.p1  ORF type:complete len:111 (+),score=30.12 TRINITY_DN6584_c0_g1_i4:83-415(+)